MSERTRREVIKLIPSCALALFLTACGATPTSPPRLETPQPLRRISGEFPRDLFYFSEILQRYNLIPKVIPEGTSALEHIKIGTNYLRRLLTALEHNPPVGRTPLSNLGDVVGPEAFVTDLSDTASAYSILTELVNDLNENRIVFVESTDQNAPFLFSPVNFPEGDTANDLTLTSVVQAHPKMPFGGETIEEGNTSYKGYTDVQIALKLVHEYMHVRQGRGSFKLMMKIHKEEISKASDPAAFVYTLMTAYGEELNKRLNLNPRKKRDEVTQVVAFYEAQANVGSQLLLHALRGLNDEKRVAGIEDDPYPPGGYTLYSTFVEALLGNHDPFDSNWLNLHHVG